MEKIHCELLCHSNSHHLQQLYTGFALLRKCGLIQLRQRIVHMPLRDDTRPQHLRDARHAHLRVVVNGSIRLHYDTHDSWELDDEFLRQADHYFKRSYSTQRLEQAGYDLKNIHPLGLGYEVYPNSGDWFGHTLRWQRNCLLEKGMRARLYRSIRVIPRQAATEAGPDRDARPRVLFMVRAWNPHAVSERSAQKIDEWHQLNRMRAQCIRLLRREFGADFYGGFVHTPYALENYADVLLPQPELGSKRAYLKLLRSYPICVATTGLHGSIGWKFAEYVSLSKAIVSEKLLYQVPGGLSPGMHYLEFASAEQCVEKARALCEDAELRWSLMSNNARYYEANLRPDVLVLRTLQIALSSAIGPVDARLPATAPRFALN